METLPTLLLISLALFFAALVDYLWTTNCTVALVVLVFAAAGALFYWFTVVVGVMDKACPFQTAVSATIRHLQSPLHPWLYSELSDTPSALSVWGPIAKGFHNACRDVPAWLRSLRACIREGSALKFVGLLLWVIFIAPFILVANIVSATLLLLLPLLIWPIQKSVVPGVLIRSALWMAETAPDRKNILAVAQNIPLITDFDALQLIAPSSAFPLLLAEFTRSILAARHNDIEANIADAVIMARGVAHVQLADPVHTSLRVRKACLAAVGEWASGRKLEGVWVGEFKLLFEAILVGCLPYGVNGFVISQFDPGARLRTLLATVTSCPSPTFQSSSDATIFLRQHMISGRDRYHHHLEEENVDVSSALLLDNITVDQAYLSCASRTLSRMIHLRLGQPTRRTRSSRARLAHINTTQSVQRPSV